MQPLLLETHLAFFALKTECSILYLKPRSVPLSLSILFTLLSSLSIFIFLFPCVSSVYFPFSLHFSPILSTLLSFNVTLLHFSITFLLFHIPLLPSLFFLFSLFPFPFSYIYHLFLSHCLSPLFLFILVAACTSPSTTNSTTREGFQYSRRY